jgi:aldehyde dehydrogenase (NAD+)
MINGRRFNTVVNYLDGVTILSGGQHDEQDLFIAPTLVEVNDMEHPLWHEEIFGPVLLIKTYRDRAELFEVIGLNPYPLAFYLFTSNKQMERLLTERVRFGGGCINNTLVHLGNPDLPFGGVGYSGMGQYHGHEGFRTFTTPKSILKSGTWFDTPVWYAPVKDWYIKALRILMK